MSRDKCQTVLTLCSTVILIAALIARIQINVINSKLNAPTHCSTYCRHTKSLWQRFTALFCKLNRLNEVTSSVAAATALSAVQSVIAFPAPTIFALVAVTNKCCKLWQIVNTLDQQTASSVKCWANEREQKKRILPWQHLTSLSSLWHCGVLWRWPLEWCN